MRKMVPTGGADISEASGLNSCTMHARDSQEASGGRAQSIATRECRNQCSLDVGNVKMDAKVQKGTFI